MSALAACRRNRPDWVWVWVWVWAGMLLTSVLLSGCTLGPDFRPPPAPTGTDYEARTLPAQTAATAVDGGQAQHFHANERIMADWWRLFGSSKLEALVQEALAHNPDIAAAQASLRQAQAQARATAGGQWPNVAAYAGLSRQQGSAAETTGTIGNPQVYNLINSSLNVGYTLDLFGSEKRQIEAAMAAVDAQQFAWQASRLTVTGAVIETTVRLAEAEDAIAATHAIIDAESAQLSVIERSYQAGHAALSDMLSARAQLASSRATVPVLAQTVAVARHQLAALTGRTPDQLADDHWSLSDLSLPTDLPISLPAALVGQRPDIAYAGAILHQASANVGVAAAAMYPQLSLSGNIGSGAYSPKNFLTENATGWGLAGGLSQPIFAGGSLLAQREAAEAGLTQAAEVYRRTVLAGIENVADCLTALHSDAESLQQQQVARQTASESATLVRKQYAEGATDMVTLLVAQRQDAQARLDFLSVLASRFRDSAALFVALGGGWWNTPQDPLAPAVPPPSD